MDAIVFYAPHEIGFQSIPLPPMTPTSVRVATKLTSISAGTERMTLEGRLPGMPQLRYPLIPGYENVGEVIEVGDEVDPAQFQVGDRVFLPGTVRYEGFSLSLAARFRNRSTMSNVPSRFRPASRMRRHC